ncbi:flavodoxin family protein [Desulfopila sp. IMCC35006]|uniref:flavodoxin family protein n=1 Tax=Desulfopila sp. IMCC35006 TaxID=2569542 RepID=UPI00142EDE6D|nr:flavodoxin family protein [Desulfopila sp. IMCC35006]
MKMLVVLGSPRKNGNSETLARKVAEAVEKSGGAVEYIRLNDLNMRPCQGCGGCEKSGNCVLNDDLTPIFQQVDDADRLVLVSPVYFYGLSAQCKIFGDRFQSRWARRYLLKERFGEGKGRKGYLISTAATVGPKIFDCSILTARYIYDAMDVEYAGELLVKGVDKRKAVLEAPDEMARAEQFGRDIVEGRL